MKKVLLIPFILLSVLLLAASVFAMDNLSEGFRGIPWGAPAPSQDSADSNKWGLVILGSADSVILYRRAEQVFVGDVKILAPVEYIFHDKLGFACAIIRFSGQEKYELLRQSCVENWGEPSSKKKGRNKKTGSDTMSDLWIGKKIFKSLNYNTTDIPDEGQLALITSDYVQTKTKINIKRLMK